MVTSLTTRDDAGRLHVSYTTSVPMTRELADQHVFEQRRLVAGWRRAGRIVSGEVWLEGQARPHIDAFERSFNR